MNLAELPPPMQEFVGTFQALRTLGFNADDIQCAVYAHGFVQGQLFTQEREFRFDCGFLPEEFHNNEPFEILYKATCAALQAATNDELDKVWRASFAYANSALFVMALVQKGFCIPSAKKKS